MNTPEDQGTPPHHQKTEKEMFLSKFSKAKSKFESAPRKKITTPRSQRKRESTKPKLQHTTPSTLFKNINEYNDKILKTNVDVEETSSCTTPKNTQEGKKTSEPSRKLNEVLIDTHEGRHSYGDVNSDSEILL